MAEHQDQTRGNTSLYIPSRKPWAIVVVVRSYQISDLTF